MHLTCSSPFWHEVLSFSKRETRQKTYTNRWIYIDLISMPEPGLKPITCRPCVIPLCRNSNYTQKESLSAVRKFGTGYYCVGNIFHTTKLSLLHQMQNFLKKLRSVLFLSAIKCSNCIMHLHIWQKRSTRGLLT